MKISMVDISGKKAVKRKVVAEGSIRLKQATIEKIKAKKILKGDPLTVAEIAAINAVKKTPEIVPLCHQIPLEKVDVSFKVQRQAITARVEVTATAKTGVEMEGIVGVVVALTNIWDMVKYLEKDKQGQYPVTRIGSVRVVKKEKDES